MLVLAIAEDFDKLFEDGRLAAIAALCEFCRVVVMAVDISLVLVIAVLGAEHSGTHGTRKVLYVVFTVQGGDV